MEISYVILAGAFDRLALFSAVNQPFYDLLARSEWSWWRFNRLGVRLVWEYPCA
jgi:hypothetical protein